MVEGKPGHRTYIMPAYAPCGNAGLGTSRKKGLKMNPKTMFQEDTLAVLRRWQEKGDRVVLIMDANKHVMDGSMCKQLAGEDLQMRDAVNSETKSPGPKTCFRSSEPIDGICKKSILQ